MQKIAGGVTTQFVFDRAGHLLEEANGSGTVLRDYIWLDDLPVAMVDDTGSSPIIYYIHTDQLGTPRKMTDGSANIVWDNLSDPFGNAEATQGTNWGAANWGSFSWAVTMLSLSNLRFPGQYFDSETALNQNWNRDYDPTTGRYVQSDPVGLLAGINTYVYVLGNPILQSDPLGLDDTMCMYNPSMCGMSRKPSESNVSIGLGAWGNLLGAYGSSEVGFDIDSTLTGCVHVQSCTGAIVGLPLQGQIGISAGAGTGTLCTGTQTTYGAVVIGGAGVGGGGQVLGNSSGASMSRGMVGIGGSPAGAVAGGAGVMCKTRYWCTK